MPERERRLSGFPPSIMSDGAEIRIDTLPQEKAIKHILKCWRNRQTFTKLEVQGFLEPNDNPSYDPIVEANLLFRQIRGKFIQAGLSIRTEGEKGNFMVVNLKDPKNAEKALDKVPKRAEKELINEDPKEEKEAKKNKPRGETSLSSSRYRTTEQRAEDRKRAFAYFTLTALSAIAGGKGLETLSDDPHNTLAKLPNGEHLVKVFPKSKEELAKVLVDGFDITIREIHRKKEFNKNNPGKPPCQFSEQELHIVKLLREIVRKNHNFRPITVPPQLRTFFDLPISSLVPQSPKGPANS